jgi:hypothetical protein
MLPWVTFGVSFLLIKITCYVTLSSILCYICTIKINMGGVYGW